MSKKSEILYDVFILKFNFFDIDGRFLGSSCHSCHIHVLPGTKGWYDSFFDRPLELKTFVKFDKNQYMPYIVYIS